MEEEINKLRARIDYLEQELGVSYEEDMFRHNVERAFPDHATIEVKSSRVSSGYFATVTGVNGNEAQDAIDKLEATDLGTALTETGGGLGVEVWTEETYGRA